MSALVDVFNAPAATALAWTLLHFLWQGASIAAVFAFVSRGNRLASSTRYAAGVLTLAAMLAAPIATYLAIAPNSSRTPAAGVMPAATPSVTTSSDDRVPVNTPRFEAERAAIASSWSMTSLVVGLWALGVCILGVRLGGGWMLTRWLVRRAEQPLSRELQSVAARVAGRLGLRRIVRVAQTPAVAVPVMIGWLKPVVLFPAAVLSGLSATQIEALLAHELAHVRRHDYAVNVFQSFIETLLFYHPAVWWVSHRVRIEREQCCDDLVLGVCDRLVYATALSELATLCAPARPALASTGGSLVNRIRRIVADSEHAHDVRSSWLPVVAFALLFGIVVPIAFASPRPQRKTAQSENTSGEIPRNTELGQGALTGGVSGGVPGGVAGGVADGVQGGIEGGVTGGVYAGVTTGVAGAEKSQPTQSGQSAGAGLDPAQGGVETESEQERREHAAKMVLDALQKQRLAEQDLTRQRLDAELKVRLAELSSELEALSKVQGQMKSKGDMGLVDSKELSEIETRMAMLQAQIAVVGRERAVAAKEMDVRAAEIARQKAELSRAMADAAVRRGALEEQAVVVARTRAGEQAALLRETIEVGEDERIRPGDLLVIEIHGEPDVPRVYSVHENGTVKLPLSAPLRVAGLTVKEVERELIQQLTARGLERPTITVTLRRHRTGDER